MRFALSYQDLGIADAAIETMASATQFPTFHQAWQDFLIRIQRAWEHAERVIHPEKGFQQWFKPYAELRKRDPLLAFLAHARNAETHAVSATVDHPLRVVIRNTLGIPFSVTAIRSTLEDGTLTIDIDTAAHDTLLEYEAHPIPMQPKLVRFKDRGKWYEVPASHLKKPLAELHPVDAAKLGVAFYKGFVKEAEFRFARRRPSTSS
jgi:hypothetical protein